MIQADKKLEEKRNSYTKPKEDDQFYYYFDGKRNWYTEDEWQRAVGWGKLPDEYKKPTEAEIGYQYKLFDDDYK